MKLEKLISSLDASAVVCTLRGTIKSMFYNCRDAVQRALKQLTKSRMQLRKVEVQLQQEIKNITPERAWWEQVWQNILTHLEPTGTSASLKDKLEAVKIRVSNPADLYKQGKISAEVYAMCVEIKVSSFVRRLPHYHSEADRKTQNKMRHEYTNYDKLIEVTRGNNRVYLQIKKRVELAIAATQVGSDEYSCEIRAVA